jgi:hypothetical protein
MQKSLKFNGFQIYAYFIWLQWLLSYSQVFDFLINKSSKINLGPMLPPGANVIKLFVAVNYDFSY